MRSTSMRHATSMSALAAARFPRADRALLARWIAANAAAEAFGLGGSVLLALSLLHLDLGGGASPAVLLALGTCEGGVVGAAQAWAMNGRLPTLPARRWIAATACGAFVAWLLGVAGATFASSSSGASTPPSDAVQLIAAVGLGLVAGPLLGAFQALALRRALPRSGLAWAAANGAAWALGMPIIFAIAMRAPPSPLTAAYALAVLGVTGLAGAVVGAVHGAALVALLRRRHP